MKGAGCEYIERVEGIVSKYKYLGMDTLFSAGLAV